MADQNYHRADKTYRKAIALEPDESFAYFNLGVALSDSGRHAEAAPLYLQAAARYPEGSDTRPHNPTFLYFFRRRQQK